MSGDPARDMAILGGLLRELIGKCRICGCEGDTCSIGGGETCSWAPSTPEKTLCNHPGCLQASEIRDRKINREKRRRGVRIMKGRVA